MSIKNIVVLTVLMSLGTHNFINGETIRGVEIQKLNENKVAGKWYLMATTRPSYDTVCMSTDVVNQSAGKLRMKLSSAMMENSLKSIQLNPLYNSELYMSMQENSNIINISTALNGAPKLYGIILDADYDSYIAFYTAQSLEDLNSGKKGTLTIVSRQKSMQQENIDKMKQSVFIQQGVDSANQLHGINLSQCPQ